MDTRLTDVGNADGLVAVAVMYDAELLYQAATIEETHGLFDCICCGGPTEQWYACVPCLWWGDRSD